MFRGVKATLDWKSPHHGKSNFRLFSRELINSNESNKSADLAGERLLARVRPHVQFEGGLIDETLEAVLTDVILGTGVNAKMGLSGE